MCTNVMITLVYKRRVTEPLPKIYPFFVNLCDYLMMVVYKSAETCSECNAYVIFVVLWYSDPVVDMNFRIICDL